MSRLAGSLALSPKCSGPTFRNDLIEKVVDGRCGGQSRLFRSRRQPRSRSVVLPLMPILSSFFSHSGWQPRARRDRDAQGRRRLAPSNGPLEVGRRRPRSRRRQRQRRPSTKTAAAPPRVGQAVGPGEAIKRGLEFTIHSKRFEAAAHSWQTDFGIQSA